GRRDVGAFARVDGWYLTPRRECCRSDRQTHVYFLNWDDALSKAFFIDVHAESIPACMFCHADSLVVRIACSFLCAASRLARITLICSSYLARASALICALLALNLSTSASHFLICDSIILKYSSFLLMTRLLWLGCRHRAGRPQ